jgi:hypothetical protein
VAHEPVDAPQVSTGMRGAGIVHRQTIEQFRDGETLRD